MSWKYAYVNSEDREEDNIQKNDEEKAVNKYK